MTEQEYNEFNNYRFLTGEEKDYERKLNSKNSYRISKNQLKVLARRHKSARARGDFRLMTRIEYRLTDINFHSECGMLCKGLYDDLLSDDYLE